MGWVKEQLIEMSRAFIQYDGNKCVCSEHFDDYYLKNHIEEHGIKGKCSYCGKKHKVLDMSSFMDMVTDKLADRLCPLEDANLPLYNSYFDRHEEPIPGFERVGCFIAPVKSERYESTEDLLCYYGLMTDNDELNTDIASCFNREDWIVSDVFHEDLDVKLSREWNRFVEMVKYSKRYTFFNDPFFMKQEECKDDILTEIKHLCESILLVTLNKGTILYRGRPNNTGAPYTSFIELTSPPASAAKENRMSANGISMFYGSFDKETSLKEIRHYDKKSNIDIGEFITTRELNVVDLSKIPHELSFWMPEYYEEYKFLHMFHNEITKPTEPGSSSSNLEYVPTQIFTEYIRYMSGHIIDGIIYKSSICSTNNIVLFYDNTTSSNILKLNT